MPLPVAEGEASKGKKVADADADDDGPSCLGFVFENWLDPETFTDHGADSFAALGVSVNPRQASGPEDFFARVRRHEHDLTLSGYIAETPDPVDFLAAL